MNNRWRRQLSLYNKISKIYMNLVDYAEFQQAECSNYGVPTYAMKDIIEGHVAHEKLKEIYSNVKVLVPEPQNINPYSKESKFIVELSYFMEKVYLEDINIALGDYKYE